MKIRDVMTRDVHLARPGDTIQAVAERMARGDFGFVPVAEGDRLIGAVTDRDLVGRAHRPDRRIHHARSAHRAGHR